MDRSLTRLLRTLEIADRLDHTLVVALSDHGEEFGEHGATGHGLFVYETTLRVPLVVTGPRDFATAELRGDSARLLDVFPTVLGAVGIKGDGGAGRPLQERGSAEQRPSYGESWWAALEFDGAELRSLHEGTWKYILAPREELYDLAVDPGEKHNLAASEPELVTDLRERLLALVGEDAEQPRGFAEAPALDAERIAQLEALGYLGGGSLADRRDLQSLLDPKDLAGVPEALHRIRILKREERWDEIPAQADRVLAVAPTHELAVFAKAHAFIETGRSDEALQLYEHALDIAPEAEVLWTGYGFTLLELGRPDEARRASRKAVTLNEDNIDARFNLAVAALRSGKRMMAYNQLKEVLRRAPNHGLAIRLAKELEAAGAPPFMED